METSKGLQKENAQRLRANAMFEFDRTVAF